MTSKKTEYERDFAAAMQTELRLNRKARGGLRSAKRWRYYASKRFISYGFRIARTLSQ